MIDTNDKLRILESYGGVHFTKRDSGMMLCYVKSIKNNTYSYIKCGGDDLDGAINDAYLEVYNRIFDDVNLSGR